MRSSSFATESEFGAAPLASAAWMSAVWFWERGVQRLLEPAGHPAAVRRPVEEEARQLRRSGVHGARDQLAPLPVQRTPSGRVADGRTIHVRDAASDRELDPAAALELEQQRCFVARQRELTGGHFARRLPGDRCCRSRRQQQDAREGAEAAATRPRKSREHSPMHAEARGRGCDIEPISRRP
jgi:hypothetical protein